MLSSGYHQFSGLQGVASPSILSRGHPPPEYQKHPWKYRGWVQGRPLENQGYPRKYRGRIRPPEHQGRPRKYQGRGRPLEFWGTRGI